MTLDEAIKHYEEIAKQEETLMNVCEIRTFQEQCKRCAEEHRQLASWLKELKTIREYILSLAVFD